jgi:alpha-amylase/alpha-mannosidase (GH57 family)
MEAAKQILNEMRKVCRCGKLKLTEEDRDYLIMKELLVDEALDANKEAWFQFRVDNKVYIRSSDEAERE